MNLPYQGYSYYVNGNVYHLGAIIPYGAYNYRVEVLYPVIPNINKEHKDIPVLLSDFNRWVGVNAFGIESENSSLYPILTLLIDVAKEIIDFNFCGSEKSYVRAVSYYVAHFLEIHNTLLKDEERKISLNPIIKDSKEPIEEKKIDMLDQTFGNFKQTTWGQLFWTIYGQRAKFHIGYGLL